jgi:hypothetical protein
LIDAAAKSRTTKKLSRKRIIYAAAAFWGLYQTWISPQIALYKVGQYLLLSRILLQTQLVDSGVEGSSGQCVI